MEARIRNPLRTVENAAGGGDGGPGRPRLPHEGNNLAIANICDRLAAVYGDKATLITIQKDNEFETTLVCPTVPKNGIGCSKKGINGRWEQIDHLNVKLSCLTNGSNNAMSC